MVKDGGKGWAEEELSAVCVKNGFFADQLPCKRVSFKRSAFRSFARLFLWQKIRLADRCAERCPALPPFVASVTSLFCSLYTNPAMLVFDVDSDGAKAGGAEDGLEGL